MIKILVTIMIAILINGCTTKESLSKTITKKSEITTQTYFAIILKLNVNEEKVQKTLDYLIKNTEERISKFWINRISNYFTKEELETLEKYNGERILIELENKHNTFLKENLIFITESTIEENDYNLNYL